MGHMYVIFIGSHVLKELILSMSGWNLKMWAKIPKSQNYVLY